MNGRDFIFDVPADQVLTVEEKGHFMALQQVIRGYTIASAAWEAVNTYNCALEQQFGTRSTAEQEAEYDLAEDNHDAAIRAVLTFSYTDNPIVGRAHTAFIASRPELIDLACHYATCHFDDKKKGTKA